MARGCLFENQLAPTDHTHVGQLLTYASGLSASTVIWIAQTFRSEHQGDGGLAESDHR